MATTTFKPTNIYALVNNITKQSVGSLPIEAVDTTSFVDLGKFILSDGALINNWFNAFYSKYGRTEVISRVYDGKSRKGIKRTPLEFGAMIERVTFEPFDAIRNPYGEMGTDENGTISPYDRTHMSEPKPNVKTFVKKKGTYEWKIELPMTQLNDAFTSADRLAQFIDGLITSMANSMALAIENLENLAVATLIVECAKADITKVTVAEGTDVSVTGSSNVLCNLIREYNDEMGYYTDTDDTSTYTGYKVTTRTYSGNTNAIKDYNDALKDKNFVSWVENKISRDKTLMASYSTIYNIDGKNTFTPMSNLVFDVHKDFVNAINRYIVADAYNREFRELEGGYNELAKWQALGNGSPTETQKVEVNGVTVNNVVCVLRDSESVAVTTYDPRNYGKFDEENERTYRWSKMDNGYLVDGQFNSVVYTMEYEASRVIDVEPTA